MRFTNACTSGLSTAARRPSVVFGATVNAFATAESAGHRGAEQIGK